MTHDEFETAIQDAAKPRYVLMYAPGRVIIETDTKDECSQVAAWILLRRPELRLVVSYYGIPIRPRLKPGDLAEVAVAVDAAQAQMAREETT